MKTIVHFLRQWYPVLLAFVCLFYSVGLGMLGHTDEALYSAHWAGTILLFSIAIRQRRITRSWALRCSSPGLWFSPFTWFLWFGIFSMATNQKSTKISWITNRTTLMRMAWEISLDSQKIKRNKCLLTSVCDNPSGQNWGHWKSGTCEFWIPFAKHNLLGSTWTSKHRPMSLSMFAISSQCNVQRFVLAVLGRVESWEIENTGKRWQRSKVYFSWWSRRILPHFSRLQPAKFYRDCRTLPMGLFMTRVCPSLKLPVNSLWKVHYNPLTA